MLYDNLMNKHPALRTYMLLYKHEYTHNNKFTPTDISQDLHVISRVQNNTLANDKSKFMD